MTNATQEAPPPAAAAPKFELAKPRTRIKTGIPTDGLGIFVGLPKGGKTTLGASIPGAVILCLERGGADRIDGWIQEVPDLATFRLAVKAAVEHPDVKTIIIDSIDVFHEWTDAEVSASFGLETSTERKEGVNGFEVWKTLYARYEKLLGYLKRSSKMTILIAHSKEPKTNKEGDVIAPGGITIPGKLGSFLAAEADFIGHVYKQQVGSATIHYLSFRGGPLGTYGSRIPELEDKIIALPRKEQWKAVEAIFAPAAKTEPAKVDEKKGAAKAAAKETK